MSSTDLSSINVIIIGAGYGGLATAIELVERGCKVRVFEAAKQLSNTGDVIMISSSATRIMRKWGDVLDKLLAIGQQPEQMVIHDQKGKVLLEQPMPPDYEGFPNLFTNRSMAQRLFYEYAESKGVEFTFGCRISEYFEKHDGAGVLVDGEKVSADLVIGADGVHSRGRWYISKKVEKPQKSGFAVYRSWFSLDCLPERDPLTDRFKYTTKDLMEVYIGEDIHSIVMVNTKLRSMTCFVTHKDKADISESWNVPGDRKDMAAVVQDWDSTLGKIINCIPKDSLIDYKLLWRDPVRTWVSGNGRIALVGDAAHPHLATSGTGGAQAIEDGATIAALLSKTGAGNISLATRVFQRLRFERTSVTQRMGWETRHRWHQTDWEALASNPDILRLPQPSWLHGSDAEQYALDNFDAVVSHLENGTPFTSTNVPDGHVHEDWTIETMMAMEGKQGAKYVVSNIKG